MVQSVPHWGVLLALVVCDGTKLAHAAVIAVTANAPDVIANDGTCSLREAIINTK